MADKFEGSDASFIKGICNEIEVLGGTTLNPYIADLSMATDIIASGISELALCVQLTTIRISLTDQKQNDWLSTLKYWEIQRGLFISFNPASNQIEKTIGDYVFRFCNNVTNGCYTVVSVDGQGYYVRKITNY